MTRPLTILVCDHRDAGLADVLRRLEGASQAAGGMRLEWTSHPSATRERLRDVLPDVVVLDPLVPGGRVEVEEVVRAREAAGATLPVLLVADDADPRDAVTGARALARAPWDVVHRGAPVEEYVMRLERLHEAARREGELGELRHRAHHDDRTDLLRPRSFEARLSEHFSAAERHRLDLALVLLDLDDFGQVNKTFDHTVGDLVIGKVGEVVRRNLRTEDVAGRLGGDEFAVLLPYTAPVAAAHVIDRLRREIRALSGRLAGSPGRVPVSASLGFETFDGADLDSVEGLRMHAELALREAKTRGGDRAVYYRSLVARSDEEERPE